VETELKKVGKALPTKVVTPMTADYRPELDQSKEFRPDQVTYFAGLIGVLHWCIKLGRIDIIVEVSLLSRFLACPHKGHHAASVPCLWLLAGYHSIAFSGC
jgi:hypothetical protein